MKRTTSLFLLIVILLASCSSKSSSAATAIAGRNFNSDPAAPIYPDPSQPIEARVKICCARMTIDEKIGQMTQVDLGSIRPGDVTNYFIGSILSGGSDNPKTTSLRAGRIW